MATSTVGRIHTHLRNAVPLVWGLLRLAPITYWCFYVLLILGVVFKRSQQLVSSGRLCIASRSAIFLGGVIY